jgi:hypothetical protein
MCLAVPGRLQVGETELPKNWSWQDAIGLAFAVRGYKWDYGTGRGFVPAPFTKPAGRFGFLAATLLNIAIYLLAFDVVGSILSLFPCSADETGISMFLQHLPPIERYFISTLTQIATSLALVVGFTMHYEITAFISVALLGSTPSDWPPIFNAPWCATSVSNFWSRRWHQILRSTTLDAGGRPLRAVLGSVGGKAGQRAGLVIGAFVVCGLIKDVGMWNHTGEWDHEGSLFFCAQAVVVLAESAFYNLIGRRVGGLWGQVWTAVVLLGGGQRLSECFITATRRVRC